MTTNNGKKTRQPGVKERAGASFTAAPTDLDQLSQIIKKSFGYFVLSIYTLLFLFFHAVF